MAVRAYGAGVSGNPEMSLTAQGGVDFTDDVGGKIDGVAGDNAQFAQDYDQRWREAIRRQRRRGLVGG